MNDLVVFDAETFYDRDYSLSKLTTEEYVRDPRFEVIGVGVKVGHHPTDWFSGSMDETRDWLHSIDWSNKKVLAHNTLFDGAILSWHFGIRPKLWLDTLSMARPIYGTTTGCSLAAVAKALGIGEKGNEVLAALGKRRADFTPAELAQYGRYCKNDVDLCRDIFEALRPQFSNAELLLIDQTIRMFTEPVLELDNALLTKYLHSVREGKAELLRTALKTAFTSNREAAAAIAKARLEGKTLRDMLMSNDIFAELLRSAGVEPPMKTSLRTGKEAYAFAKTDKEFTALQEHEDPTVQALVSARLGVKSTIEETRAERFVGLSERGAFPIPLNYSGAFQTWRWSGADKINCFTAGHELLTPDGWVKIEEWEAAQPIMQWWPDGRLTWETTPGKLEKEHDGPLIQFHAPFVRATVTPEHRMVGSYNGRIKERTAEWVAEHSGLDGCPVAGVYEGPSGAFTEDEVRLLVAIAADATALPRGHFVFGFKRERKIARLHALLQRMGIAYTTNKYPSNDAIHFRIPARAVPKAVADVGKGFGPWVLRLDRAGLAALVDEVRYWDGFANHQTGATTFCTTLKDQAEWVATAAHLAGQRASVYKYKRDRCKTGCVYHVYFGTSDKTAIDTAAHVKVLPASKTTVYCPAVESSYVLVRNRGRIFVAGQCQNMPRGGTLRHAIRAPEGHLIVAVDSSNIELRVNHTLAGQLSSVESFRAGRDLYCEFASVLFGRPITKADKNERQLGKLAHLSLGYGCGWQKFQHICRLNKVTLTDEEAQRIVKLWRDTYSMIPKFWRAADAALPAIFTGVEQEVGPSGLILTCGEGLRTPPQHMIRYAELRREEDGGWTYLNRKQRKSVYGGSMVENICQHIARNIIADQWVKSALWCAKNAPEWRVVLQVHDEIVLCGPARHAELVEKAVVKIMSTSPTWWPEVPLAAEGGIGATYGDAH